MQPNQTYSWPFTLFPYSPFPLRNMYSSTKTYESHNWLQYVWNGWPGVAQPGERSTVGWKIWVSNPGGWERFLANFQNVRGAHPASCTTDTGSFPGLKRPGRGVVYPPTLETRLKKEKNYTSSPPLELHVLFQDEIYFAFEMGQNFWCKDKSLFITYTGCPRRNVPNFGRVFLMLKYTDITQNTFIQSWTVTEIMTREIWNFDSSYTLIDYQIHNKTGRNMWFL